jgi:hypothetical protein
MKRFSFFFFFFALFSAYSLAVDAQHVAFGDMPEDALVPTGKVVSVEVDEIAMAALSWHAGRTDNPHGLTPAAIGALGNAWAATGTVHRATGAGGAASWLGVQASTGVVWRVERTIGVVGDAKTIVVVATGGAGYNGPEAGTIFTLESTDFFAQVFTNELSGFFVMRNFEGNDVSVQHTISARAWYVWPDTMNEGGEHILHASEDWGQDGIGWLSLAFFGMAENACPLATLSDVETAVESIESGVTNAAHDVASSLIGHPFVLQGSTVVSTTNVAYTLSGVATDGGDFIHLMPYQATRPSEAGSTGTLHIATAPDTYIVDVSGDIRVTECEYGSLPKDNFPVEWSSSRVDDTNWIISAWAPGEVSTYEPKSGQGYYATISNLVVYTYNRPGYWPNTLTNDTAALPFFVDSADVARAPARRAVNSGSVRDYVTSRKREIAASAWRLTPSGKDAPSPNFVTLDLPLVQQGNIAFLQQGDYYVMSYDGGDWRTSTEGSSWQIGASGRADLTITSEGRMAFIRDFAVAGQVATIYCATNWMGGAASSNGVPSGADPYVEFSGSIDNPQWLACQDCTRSYVVDSGNGDYWLFQAPATESKMFYRVVIPGGERRIIAGPTLRLNAGIEVGGVRYDLVTITNGLEVFEVVGRRVAP